MSKSVGNVVDPWQMIEKYGVDTLRMWMYSVNQPGESKNFDERSVEEVQKRIFNLLDNVYTFYELYRDTSLEANSKPKSKNILDAWILVRLGEVSAEMTKDLDAYKLLEPTRALRDFIDDLSTWYLRRSRDRMKDGDAEAKQTLYYVLKTVSKLIAPFAPFAAEDLYQKLRTQDDVQSVHLEDWPYEESFFSRGKSVSPIVAHMGEVRRLVSLALEARSRASIKIRQPLQKLSVKNLKLGEEYRELVKDEVNVKEVVADANIESEVLLDTALNPELIEEGQVREIIRSIQERRKEKGLKPGEKMEWPVPAEDESLYGKYAEMIKKATSTEFV
jgi:isoleucyl-tRNA synthetase